MASEPIDELAVRLVADAEGFLADIDAEVEGARDKLGELPDAADEAAEALEGDLRRAALDMIATTRLLGISLEEAAEKLEGMAMGAGFSAEQLLAAARQMDAQGAAVVEAAVNRIVVAAENAGVQLSENVIENYQMFFQTIVTEARRVEEEGPIAIENALGRIVEAGEEAGADFSDAQTQVFEDYLEDIDDIGDHMPPAQAAIEGFTSAVEGQFNAMQQGNAVANAFTGQIKQLVSQLVSGLTVVALFNKGLQLMRQGIADATDLANAQFRLAVAVRAQQAAYGESAGTIDEWNTFARQLAEDFGRPTEKTVLDVAASINLMTQNMDLSADQMQNLLRNATALANITGRELDPTMRQLVRFIQTGANRAIGDLGVVMDDITLQTAAANLGFERQFDQLSETEQRLVRYHALLEQTAFALEDADARQGTLLGRLDKTNQQFKRASQLLGQILLPSWVRFREALSTAAEAFVQIITLIRIFQLAIRGNLVAALAAGAAAFQTFWDQLRSGERLDPGQIFRVFDATFMSRRAEEIDQHMMEIFDSMGGLGDRTEEEMGQARDALDDFVAGFPEASEAIDDAMQRWVDGVADAQQKLQDRLEDIDQDYRDRLQDLKIDLQRDLADIDRDAARDRMEALRENQMEEIRAREDHMREVERLEREYLFNLEDAVRERDARAVLDLQRRFKAEKNELEEEYELRKKRRKEDLQLELQDIERRRRIKREERILSFQQELEDLAQMRERRRRDAHETFRRELRDLRNNITRRLRLQANGIQQQLQLNHEGLKALYDQLDDAYGPNGWVEAFYNRYAQIIAGAGGTESFGALAPGSRDILGRQRGGTLLATSPTMLEVGEGRPERVDVTPLSASTGQASAGFRGGGGMGGRAVIEVRVDADEKLLVRAAEFVENDIADIFIDVNQGQRGGRGIFRG